MIEKPLFRQHKPYGVVKRPRSQALKTSSSVASKVRSTIQAHGAVDAMTSFCNDATEAAAYGSQTSWALLPDTFHPKGTKQATFSRKASPDLEPMDCEMIDSATGMAVHPSHVDDTFSFGITMQSDHGSAIY
jgi:hypothetical protein